MTTEHVAVYSDSLRVQAYYPTDESRPESIEVVVGPEIPVTNTLIDHIVGCLARVPSLAKTPSSAEQAQK